MFLFFTRSESQFRLTRELPHPQFFPPGGLQSGDYAWMSEGLGRPVAGGKAGHPPEPRSGRPGDSEQWGL